MRWDKFLMCCWPGLSRLWLRGHWSALLVAIGFGVLLNLALVSTFLWPNSLGATFPMVVWPTLCLVWVVSCWVTIRTLPDVMAVGRQSRENTEKTGDTLFNQAQREYLRGNWIDAEKLLARRLELEPRDMESRLLLATLLRHSRRLARARSELDSMQKFDESINWKFEIRREGQLIELIEQAEREDNIDVTTVQELPTGVGFSGT